VLVRNYVVGGDLVPVASQGGLNFYLGNHEGADGRAALAPEFRATWSGGLEDSKRLAEKAEGLRRSPATGMGRRGHGRRGTRARSPRTRRGNSGTSGTRSRSPTIRTTTSFPGSPACSASLS
jgi:hypothetical protein